MLEFRLDPGDALRREVLPDDLVVRIPAFARLVETADESACGPVPLTDDASLAVEKRGVVPRHHPDLHPTAAQEVVKPLVPRSIQQAVEVRAGLVPLLFEQHLSGEPGRADVFRIEIAVADDLDTLDPLKLLVDQLENRGA